MTNEERIAALQAFGYSEGEAEFLCLAALHSGYLLRRQYRDFLGQSPGWVDDSLVRKLLALGHATEELASRRTRLYHLCSRTLYAAIDQFDNRHRRRRPPFAIKAKLMALDFVLANPGNIYFPTEEEKMTYFTRELGFQKEVLPTKIYRSPDGQSVTHRYFVDKFPIFIAPVAQPDPPPVVSFCFVDEGSISTPGFQTYLTQYARLFQALGSFQLVYIATQEKAFDHARKTLDHHLHGRSHHGRLLEYLKLENLYQTKRFDCLDVQKLERLRMLRKQFQADAYSGLLAAWNQGGEAAVSRILNSGKAGLQPLKCDFKTCLLRHDYDIFGYSKNQQNRPGRSK